MPDLNCGDFSKITFTKMLKIIDETITGINDEYLLVGSSMGGYLAALYIENYNRLCKRMLLLAPGFDLYNLFYKWLSDYGIRKWEKEGFFNFMHYAYNKEFPLWFDFYRDLKQYSGYPYIKDIPCHIIHGKYDDVVPKDVSINFVNKNPNTTLEFIDDFHELGKSIPLILTRIETNLV